MFAKIVSFRPQTAEISPDTSCVLQEQKALFSSRTNAVTRSGQRARVARAWSAVFDRPCARILHGTETAALTSKKTAVLRDSTAAEMSASPTCGSHHVLKRIRAATCLLKTAAHVVNPIAFVEFAPHRKNMTRSRALFRAIQV
jgi:hypothetical protein